MLFSSSVPEDSSSGTLLPSGTDPFPGHFLEILCIPTLRMDRFVDPDPRSAGTDAPPEPFPFGEDPPVVQETDRDDRNSAFFGQTERPVLEIPQFGGTRRDRSFGKDGHRDSLFQFISGLKVSLVSFPLASPGHGDVHRAEEHVEIGPSLDLPLPKKDETTTKREHQIEDVEIGAVIGADDESSLGQTPFLMKLHRDGRKFAETKGETAIAPVYLIKGPAPEKKAIVRVQKCEWER
jgi:hypothetical protein